jgi:lysophospholipase L1-like esterase
MVSLRFFRKINRSFAHQLITRNTNLNISPCFILNQLQFFGKHFAAVSTFCMIFCLWNTVIASSQDSTKHWVGTWAAAPYKAESNLPPMGLSNNTLRQIVRVSISGDTLRLKFSNITCGSAVTMNKVNIAVSPDGTKPAVDASTITELKFNGNADVTINPKSEIYSDPVAFDLDTSMRVAITIYYGQCQSSADMTFHYGSRTNSYILSGDKTTSADFNGATTVERWFTISTIDVLAPKTAAAVAAIGNSITDGAGLSGGLQNRWTDRFSEALLANEATREVGVLNLGIGATMVLSPGNGADAGVVRFKHDILEQSGLHWVIIFYGVNDINGGRSANDIFNGIKQMAKDAHAKDPDIKVYGGTITPFNGHSYYSGAHEATRNQINEMIRTSTDLDGVIDFAEAIEDPNDPSRMKQEYKEGGWNDGLHPGPVGHEAMGKCIDLEMFTPPVKVIESNDIANNSAKAIPAIHINNGTVSFELTEESHVSLKLYSINGKEIAELAGRTFLPGRHTLPLGNTTLSKGTYLFSLKTDKGVVSRKIIIPGN